jgi:hypothetical protein
MTFYNTINENPNELARSQSKAKTQEQKIINCFKLEKTNDFVMGNYGKKEHLWCLPKKPESFSQSTLSF